MSESDGDGVPAGTARAAPLVSIRDLCVRYAAGDDGMAGGKAILPALSGISLDLLAGERLAVIGESGSGKSTLALAVAGLLPATARIEGTIRWGGPTATLLAAPCPGSDYGFVFQDPSASLDPVMRVGDQVAEVVRAHGDFGRRTALERARDLFARTGLPGDALRAWPHQLSGGQKQRVAIAAAIAAGPRLLIADEATSALDTIVQAGIVALLRRLAAEDGMTLLFVTHDIALAATLASRIAVLRQGEMVELGDAADLLARPRHPYTRALLAAHIGLDTPMLRQEHGIE